MRRNSGLNSGLKNRESRLLSDKIILYCGIGVVLLAVIVFALLMYSKSLNEDVKKGTMTLEQMANIANNTSNTQSASSQMGKTVEESEKENSTAIQNIVENSENSTNSTNFTNSTNTTNSISNTTENKSKTNTALNTNNIKTNKNTEKDSTKTNASQAKKEDEKKVESKKELSFGKPVDGEISKAFAKDNLVYSETLKEWVTHMGVDIKAEKTTVVKSAEAGSVKSIKNDPRYGLTIVIEHDDGFQTVYSNLLTSEFVIEGEKVKKGQSIGTVGNTAAFEIADEAHLHFEILKDSIPQDPSIYLK